MFLNVSEEWGVTVLEEEVEDLLLGEDLALRVEHIEMVVLDLFVHLLELFRQKACKQADSGE